MEIYQYFVCYQFENRHSVSIFTDRGKMVHGEAILAFRQPIETTEEIYASLRPALATHIQKAFSLGWRPGQDEMEILSAMPWGVRNEKGYDKWEARRERTKDLAEHDNIPWWRRSKRPVTNEEH